MLGLCGQRFHDLLGEESVVVGNERTRLVGLEPGGEVRELLLRGVGERKRDLVRGKSGKELGGEYR